MKDALQQKMKNRNLEIESSVAFVKDSKFVLDFLSGSCFSFYSTSFCLLNSVKIEWDQKCDEICVDSITVRAKSQEIEHYFGKLSVSFKLVDKSYYCYYLLWFLTHRTITITKATKKV